MVQDWPLAVSAIWMSSTWRLHRVQRARQHRTGSMRCTGHPNRCELASRRRLPALPQFGSILPLRSEMPVFSKCHSGSTENAYAPSASPGHDRSIAKKRQVLSPTTFAARFANPVALGALKLRPDLNQRSATGRTGRLALLFDLLSFRFPNVCASRVLILELHLFRPLL